jgi:hypothetical protein
MSTALCRHLTQITRLTTVLDDEKPTGMAYHPLAGHPDSHIPALAVNYLEPKIGTD